MFAKCKGREVTKVKRNLLLHHADVKYCSVFLLRLPRGGGRQEEGDIFYFSIEIGVRFSFVVRYAYDIIVAVAIPIKSRVLNVLRIRPASAGQLKLHYSCQSSSSYFRRNTYIA